MSHDKFNRHYIILKLVGELGSISHREICKKLDISIGSVYNDLKKLREEKFLEKRTDKKILTREGKRSKKILNKTNKHQLHQPILEPPSMFHGLRSMGRPPLDQRSILIRKRVQ